MTPPPENPTGQPPSPHVTVSVGGAPVRGAREAIRATITDPNAASGTGAESQTAAELAQLSVELLELLTGHPTDEVLRSRIRLLAIRFAGAMGVGHVTRAEDGVWDLKPGFANGRMPRRHDFSDALSARCQQVIKLNSVQVDALPQVEGCYGVFAPVGPPASGTSDELGQNAEILLLIISDTKDARLPIDIAGRLTTTLAACLKNQHSTLHQWQIDALSALIDLVSSVEKCQSVNAALEHVANELSRYLNIGNVAVAASSASPESTAVGTMAVSGISKIDTRSSGHHAYQQCLAESLLREEPAVWPPVEEANDQLLLAHRQLASELNTESVFSCPLVTTEGKCVGVWLFAGSTGQVTPARFVRFVLTAAPRIAGAIDAVARTEHPRWIRVLTELPEKLKQKQARVAMVIAGLLLVTLLLPVSYRVRCHCTVEPDVRRFAVAPFDGTVLKGFVRPGDEVKKGQVLARMDGRALRYEMAEVSAEHSIAIKQRAIELADRDIPKMLLAELDGQRLQAEQDLLDFKRDNLQIKSPVDGVVLTGSLENAEASAVRTGDVLFEVGALNRKLIHIEVPADEVAQVAPGQHVTVWIQGRESLPLRGQIARVRPQSELKNADNVFIAELLVENDDVALLPGMQGSARINGKTHSLGWNLFHKPFDWFWSRLSW